MLGTSGRCSNKPVFGVYVEKKKTQYNNFQFELKKIRVRTW